MTELSTAPQPVEASEVDSTIPLNTSNEIEPAKAPVPVIELTRASQDIKLAFEGNTDFEKSYQARKAQAKVVLEAWMRGEITLDQATDIFGTDGAELEMALETDPLMDIPNRMALERNILEQIALARRNGTAISVAFIDLDKFGDINKRWEEDAGDATLQAVGTYLKSELERPTDKAMRRSGEEIIVLLPDTEEDGALHVLEGMRERMPESVAQMVREIGGYEFDRPITFSAGVVTQRIDRNDPREDGAIRTELLSHADARMRLAKENGRNQVVGTSAEARLLEQKTQTGTPNG